MERRQFLQGMLASVSAGTALVQLASAEEVAALVINEPVLINQPKPAISRLDTNIVGMVLFAQLGDMGFVPVGVCTSLNFIRQIHQDFCLDGEHLVTPGLWEGHGEFITNGPAIMKVFGK